MSRCLLVGSIQHCRRFLDCPSGGVRASPLTHVTLPIWTGVCWADTERYFISWTFEHRATVQVSDRSNDIAWPNLTHAFLAARTRQAQLMSLCRLNRSCRLKSRSGSNPDRSSGDANLPPLRREIPGAQDSRRHPQDLDHDATMFGEA